MRPQLPDILYQAVTIPSLSASDALEVLADLWLEQGWKTGLVTSEHHDSDRARRKFLGHVFCRAWQIIMGPYAPFSMSYRLSGPLLEEQCWVRFWRPF